MLGPTGPDQLRHVAAVAAGIPASRSLVGGFGETRRHLSPPDRTLIPGQQVTHPPQQSGCQRWNRTKARLGLRALALSPRAFAGVEVNAGESVQDVQDDDADVEDGTEDSDAEDADANEGTEDAGVEATEDNDAQAEDDDVDGNLCEVLSAPLAHADPASGTGTAEELGGVSSRLRPLRSRLRCRAWTVRARPSMVSR